MAAIFDLLHKWPPSREKVFTVYSPNELLDHVNVGVAIGILLSLIAEIVLMYR